MKKRHLGSTLGVFSAVLGAAVVVLLAPWIYLRVKTQPRIYGLGETVPPAPVAIVFGAGLRRDGTPTQLLADRVSTAADLYRAGLVRKLLLSGDNRTPSHNEPESMRLYALQLGVPNEDLVLDPAGTRSYDTCYRARFAFGVQEAILVTQDFHLPRVIYTCEGIGIRVVGVSADRHPYRLLSQLFWSAREVPASGLAVLDINVFRPQPVLGPFQPIFPSPTQAGSRGKP
ncbi:MAG: ElyC/SanA/YdcF family protein [Anaerolineales bacterium]|jgi:vancomycin permeability regulator SanA